MSVPEDAGTQLPYTLIAELTYRCPLRCPYCSNPLDFRERRDELSTEQWLSVLDQARELGVLQLHFSGGEPLLRRDLLDLVVHSRALGFYTNLVTSGMTATRKRLAELCEAGLDCVQVSVQGADKETAERVAGCAGHDQKLQVMRWVKELGLPLTMNVVLHQGNLHEVDAVVALAEEVGADRLELANTQYLGWALLNRAALLPTRAALVSAHERARAAAARLSGRMEVLFVSPDYHARFPRACMDGWGRRFLQVTPDGLALPCHAAASITQLSFERVTDRSLSFIWHESAGFNAFRGEAWMQAPCRDCERRTRDFGGCRCQAFALTGDATATDPVCELAPQRGLVMTARRAAERDAQRVYLYRGARR